MNQNIAVNVGAAIAYVTGTVNGNVADFIKTSDTIWVAVVPRSHDGSYDIKLQAYDEFGQMSEFNTIMRYGFDAVTNRGPGTYYDNRDLNRVGAAVNYLADMLNALGYSVSIKARTNWTDTETFYMSDGDTYLGYIRTLAAKVPLMASSPQLPETMDHLGYQGANAIEQLLVDMHIMIDNISKAFYYSGEIYSGEV